MIFEPLSISSIMHEYEQTRLNNKRLSSERRNEIYSKIPAIEELDSTSTGAYISSALARINTGQDISNQVTGTKAYDKSQDAGAGQ